MKKIIIIVILFPLLLMGCKEKTENVEKAFLDKAIAQLNVPEYYKWLIIIPGSGCHGCIQEGELFMKRNIEKSDILYILTKTSSLKILQQKTGIRLGDHSNIYVDTATVFDIPTNNAIYPCIVKMDQRRVISFSFQSPSNNAFKQIK